MGVTWSRASLRCHGCVLRRPFPGWSGSCCPCGKLPLLDPEGFLLPPSEGWPVGGDEEQPRRVLDLVQDGSSFALLAAGGAGKSETFSAMSAADPERGVHRRRCAAPGGHRARARRTSRGANRTVYLDGLDQTAIQDPAVLRWLADQLTAPAADGISWRLACRSAAWETSLSDALRRSRDGFNEWKLLPLDREAAVRAVAGRFGGDLDAARSSTPWPGLGSAPDRVRRPAPRHRAVLAAQGPAARWRGRGDAVRDHGVGSRDQPGLADQPSPLESKVAVAKRLGAMMTFSGEQVVSVAPGMTEALSVDELRTIRNPQSRQRRIDVEHYREVLGTSLFDPGPAGTVTFRHQRYPEFLAAAYLVDRRASEDQVTDLVGARETGAVPASMIPVVAWLAALAPDSIRDIVVDNAYALAAAAAAVELPDGRARAVIVGGLLDAAARNEAEPDWSIAPSTLVHHGLEAQLADRLAAGPLTPQQMWWVARLAQAGGVPRVGEPTWRPRRTTPAGSTTSAAQPCAAVGAVGDDGTKSSLGDLLHPGADEDVDNEVLAAVIDALYPRLLTTAELLGALRPQPSDGLFGGYALTLRQLAERIPDDDLPAVLAWLGSPDNEIDFDARSYFAGLLRSDPAAGVAAPDTPAVARRPCDRARVLRRAQARAIADQPHLPVDGRRHATSGAPSPSTSSAPPPDAPTSATSSTNSGCSTTRTPTGSSTRSKPAHPRSRGRMPTACHCFCTSPSAQLADRILGLPDTHPAAAAAAYFRGRRRARRPRLRRRARTPGAAARYRAGASSAADRADSGSSANCFRSSTRHRFGGGKQSSCSPTPVHPTDPMTSSGRTSPNALVGRALTPSNSSACC